MPSADSLLPFFLATAVFACAPGPGMLYAAAQTLALGRRAGWWSALGLHIAGFGHIAVAAFGVATLLAMAPGFLTVVELAGIAFLLWMGLAYLRRRPTASRGDTFAATATRPLRDSLVVEALNPKSALFFLAFLPQFADPAAAFPVWLQILLLGLVVNAMFTLTDALLVEAAHFLATCLSTTARLELQLQRLGGCLLIALALHLALNR